MPVNKKSKLIIKFNLSIKAEIKIIANLLLCQKLKKLKYKFNKNNKIINNKYK